MYALGWWDPCSPTAEWDSAQVRRLAKRLGYELRLIEADSLLGLVEQVEAGGAEVLVLPSSAHIDRGVLNRLRMRVDVECAAPRESFARWNNVSGCQG